jgi:activator of HSP90 ATPase
MANAIYPIYKNALMTAAANVSLDQNTATDGPYVALIDTGTYTYSAAHDFYNDLSGVVGTDQRITTPTVGSVSNGTFDGDNVTFTAVTGNSIEALVIYRKNSGANTTWRLNAFIDTSVTGLPVTPNGGDIAISWNASGIFTL